MADTLFQRTAGAAGAASSVAVALSTTSVSGITTCQIAGYTTVEIAVIGAQGAAVHFTDAGAASGTAATVPGVGGAAAGDRAIPGNTVAYEYLPQGCSFVSATPITASGVATTAATVVFTPGKAINPD